MYPIKMDQQSEQSGRILDYLSYVLCEGLYIVYQIFICLQYMGMGQNLVPLVNIKIAGKWYL